MNEDDDELDPPGLTDGTTDYEPEVNEDPGYEYEPGQEPEPEPEPEPGPARTAQARTAPTFDARGMSEEQRAALAERMFSDPLGVLDEYNAYRDRQRDTAAAAIEYHYRDYERRAPVFFSENAPAIRHAISLLPADQRTGRDAVGYAMLHAIGQDAQANGGDVIGAIQRAAKQIEGAGTPAARSGGAPRDQESPRRPDPPSARTPGGGSTRPVPSGRSAGTGRRAPAAGSYEARLAKNFGGRGGREIIDMEDDR